MASAPTEGSGTADVGSAVDVLCGNPEVSAESKQIEGDIHRSRLAKRVGIALLALGALALVYALSLAIVFMASITRIEVPEVLGGSALGDLNVLLVGSDSRDGLSAAEQERLHTGSTGGWSSDAVMLLHIPAVGTPTLVSIPRDSFIPIVGYDRLKLKAAYAIGGPQLLTATVEQDTGVDVTDYVEVGIGGVAGATDALGGVVLCPERDYEDADSGLSVRAGCQRMGSAKAVAYVRMRKADPRDDLGRVERQQEFLHAAMRQTASPTLWAAPWRAYPAARQIGSVLTVSEGTSPVALARITAAMAMLAVDAGTATTVPTQPGTFEVEKQEVRMWDDEQARALFESLR